MSNSNQSNSIEIEMKSVNDVVNGDVKVPQESESVSNVDENAVKSSSPAVTNDMEIKESPKIECVPDYQPEETMNSFGVFTFYMFSFLACHEYYERNCWNRLFSTSSCCKECSFLFIS